MKRLIGTKQFYKTTLMIAIPIILQYAISTCVNMVDNMMIGQLGEHAMNGVSVVNQLFSILSICIYGAFSAPSIFTSQFAGKKDDRGIQYCFYFKCLIGLLIFILGMSVMYIKGTDLINLYLNGNPEDNMIVLNHAKTYLNIIMISYPFLIISQTYGTTIRDTGDTLPAMLASSIAVGLNCGLNAILIFGLLGFPALGVKGAAIATLISRICESLIIIGFAHVKNYSFIKNIYHQFEIPVDLFKSVFIKGIPLFLNEFLWSFALAACTQCFSVRGLDAIAAINITLTIYNVFLIMDYSTGTALSIIVSNKLGANETDDLYETVWQLIVFNTFLCTLSALGMILCRNQLTNIYAVSDDIKSLSNFLLLFSALDISISGVYYGCYYTLRSGGKSLLTMAFDSGYNMLITFPVLFVLSRFTQLDVIYLYAIYCCMNIPKVFLGINIVKQKTWMKTMV